MKVTRRGDNVFPEFKRYAKIIKAAPGFKTVLIYDFKTRAEAETKAKRLVSWKYKVIVTARDERGRFAKGVVLICCK